MTGKKYLLETNKKIIMMMMLKWYQMMDQF